MFGYLFVCLVVCFLLFVFGYFAGFHMLPKSSPVTGKVTGTGFLCSCVVIQEIMPLDDQVDKYSYKQGKNCKTIFSLQICF